MRVVRCGVERQLPGDYLLSCHFQPNIWTSFIFFACLVLYDGSDDVMLLYLRCDGVWLLFLHCLRSTVWCPDFRVLLEAMVLILWIYGDIETIIYL